MAKGQRTAIITGFVSVAFGVGLSRADSGPLLVADL